MAPSESAPSEPAAGDGSDVADAAVEVIGVLKARSRILMFAGLGLIGLAFILSWWSLTKYRVSYERGVNLAVPADVKEMFDDMGDDRPDYDKRIAEYAAAWSTNTKQYGAYYADHFGGGYVTDLQLQMDRSLESGTIFYRGWSTWTGWLGMLTILAVVGLYVAPKFAPEQMEPWAWTAPWAAAALGGLYLICALAFYFNVPDENGAGYSQGVAFGGYVAILAGLATTLGGVFEGLSTAKQRLQAIESEPEDAEEEDETAPSPSAAPKRPAAAPAAKPPDEKPKNRLTDW